MIPAGAVEAAVGNILRSLKVGDFGVYRRDLVPTIRAALEAAAPHMLAEAWDEGWDTFAGFDSRPGGPYPANPYRPTP